MKLSDVAAAVSGTLVGDPSVDVNHIASLDSETADSLTFILTPNAFQKNATRTFLAAITFKELPNVTHQIIVKNPRKALAETIELFFPSAPTAGISPGAHVAASATVGLNTTIYPGANIGENVVIGANCTIHPNVTIYANTIIGTRVIIHAGTTIGSDGFGYYHDQGKFKKIPHIGRVVIGDDVEIGANVAIDRGVLDNTEIGSGTKIDNLCHIAHNTKIGTDCAIAGQTGTVGHSVIGNRIQIGGQVGINDVTIGDDAIIAARSGVTRSVPPRSMVSGFPAGDHIQELKKDAWFRRQYLSRKDKK